MSRRLAREVALRALFQIDAGHAEADEAVDYNASLLAATESDTSYARALVQATLAHLEAIDAMIGKQSHDWAFGRLTGTDKAILRMSLGEMLHLEASVPAAVVISEAVELAKRYGDEASGKFVNGVLGALARAAAPSQPTSP